MPDLELVEQLPLPVSWDGRRVEWVMQDRFDASFKVFLCPPPKQAERCSSCKSSRSFIHWRGTTHPLEGETFPGTVAKTGRYGRTVHVPRDLPAWPTMDLVAFRCPDCLHDEVWDLRTNLVWDLGPEDYGPEGSTEPV